MARRQRNRSALAGLAALGALGYISGKGPLGGLYKRREGDPAPVEDRGTSSQASASRARASADSDYQPSTGFMEQGFYSPEPSPDYVPLGAGNMEAGLYGPNAETGGVGRVDVAAAPSGSMGPIIQGGAQAGARPPAGPAVRPAASGARPSSGQGAGAAAPVGGLSAAALDAAYGSYPQFNPIAAAFADQSRGQDVIQPAANQSRSLNQRPARQNVSSAARQYNQDAQGNRAGTQADGGPPITEEMRRNPAARIPGQRTSGPQGGQRVTGNETTRNIQNILNAPVPGMVPFGRGAGAAGRAASTSREVGSLKETPVTFLGRSGPRPVRGPERLEGGRASQPRLTDDKASRAAIEAERRKRLGFESKKSDALDESDWTGGAGAYGAKKGGAIKVKKMASGGMSSASKRGDGIASKGKTKCKMY